MKATIINQEYTLSKKPPKLEAFFILNILDLQDILTSKISVLPILLNSVKHYHKSFDLLTFAYCKLEQHENFILLA